MSREPEVASMRNEDRFKEEGIPLLSYRWYAPIALNSNSIDNFLSRDNILFLFLENIVLYYGYSFLYFMCRKLILDNQNLYRCETKSILKKIYRFCRIDFVDMHRLDSNSIDNTFWEIIVLYMHVPFGYTLYTENWYYNIILTGRSSTLAWLNFRSNDQPRSKKGESVGRFVERHRDR